MGWVLLSNVFCEAISLLSQLARRCDDVWILLADGVVTLRVTDWRLFCAGCQSARGFTHDEHRFHQDFTGLFFRIFDPLD